MCDNILTFLSGGFVSILTLVINSITEYKKSEYLKQQDLYDTKRNKLADIYTNLSKIINLFPHQSPNEVLGYVEQSPFYEMENFVPIRKSLQRKIVEYEKRLLDRDLEIYERDELEVQKVNIENVLTRIKQIEHDYIEARDCYKNFCITDKAVIDLYSGQKVRDNLVEFELLIYNVFVSGKNEGESSSRSNNIIDITRRRLIDSMREDIGIR